MKMAAAYVGFNIEKCLLLSWPNVKMYTCTFLPSSAAEGAEFWQNYSILFEKGTGKKNTNIHRYVLQYVQYNPNYKDIPVLL